MGFSLLAALACGTMDSHLAARREGPTREGDEDTAAEEEILREPTTGHVARPVLAYDPGPPGDVLFAPDVIQDLEITLSDSAYRSLRDHPDEEVEGELTWRSHTSTVGVKLKGSSSFRSIREKSSFKIDVHAYDAAQRIDGLKRLTLNNMIQDPTMLREHAYYWLAAQVGVPAPRHAYARVTVNGEPYGLYGLVETMDGRAMKRLWPDDKDGNLYEGSGADFTYDRDWFDLQVDGGIVPVEEDMEALVDAVVEAGDDEFWTMVGERFDVDALVGYLALDMVAGNDDGYVFNHHNYHVYHLAYGDRWALLPWGTDRSFTNETHPFGSAEAPVVGVLAQRCLDDDACTHALHERIEGVLDVWEGGGFHELLAETASAIEEACQDDPRREKGCDHEDIQDFAKARADRVRDALE